MLPKSAHFARRLETMNKLLRLFTMLLFGFAVYVVSDGTLAASRLARADVGLDQLIPRENWTVTGLKKLTEPEQQKLASEITVLLDERRTKNDILTGKDRSQWRKLQRRMSKDDVRKLLGEPF